MIRGIGTDLVRIARIARSHDRFGAAFARKILTEGELLTWQDHARPVEYLAGRFAAKEAVSKALGTGMRAGVHFHLIEVSARQGRAPDVHLLGRALAHAERLGVTRSFVTVSHDGDYAVAFAILEGDD